MVVWGERALQFEGSQGYLAHKKTPIPQDHRKALGIDLLKGPRGRCFLLREVPLSAAVFSVKRETNNSRVERRSCFGYNLVFWNTRVSTAHLYRGKSNTITRPHHDPTSLLRICLLCMCLEYENLWVSRLSGLLRTQGYEDTVTRSLVSVVRFTQWMSMPEKAQSYQSTLF